MEDLYWSPGARTRARLLRHARRCAEAGRPFYEAGAARACRMSASAARDHIRRMAERGLFRPVNPGGRPLFLEMTEEGRRVEREMDALLELGGLLRKQGRWNTGPKPETASGGWRSPR